MLQTREAFRILLSLGEVRGCANVYDDVDVMMLILNDDYEEKRERKITLNVMILEPEKQFPVISARWGINSLREHLAQTKHSSRLLQLFKVFRKSKTNIVPWGALKLERNTLSFRKSTSQDMAGNLWRKDNNNNNTNINSCQVKGVLISYYHCFLRLRWDGHAVKPTLLNEQVTHNINHKMNKKCIWSNYKIHDNI